jgi:fatty acid desaturase
VRIPEKSTDFKVSREILKEVLKLNKADNHSGIIIILFNYLLVAICVWLTLRVSYWFYPLSLIVIGSVHRTFANLLHDGSHGILAADRTLNRIYGAYLTGYVIFHMVMPYKQSHLLGHHRYLGDPDKDPDFLFQRQCGMYNPREKNWIFFTKYILLAVLGYRSLSYIRYIFRDRIFFNTKGLSKEKRRETMRERFNFLATWAVILTGLALFGLMKEFLFFWIVPMFTTSIAIAWLAELSEHYPLPDAENTQLMLTRNRHGWWIENFLFGRHGDRYHLIHHLSPSIPCYRLKAAHQILLKDECYRAWDSLWGGIFTKVGPDKETLTSYVRKYKNWQQGGLKVADDQSFGFHILRSYLGLIENRPLKQAI